LSWRTRSELGAASAGGPAAGAAGLLVGALPGEGCVAIPAEARARVRKASAATLSAAGVRAGQRVLVSLNNDGDLAGAQLADALVELGASAAAIGPRGRMRTLAAFRALRPSVWITTPTGALDFLARLYLEFNVDPLELELDRILIAGEIPSPGTSRRLAGEFEAELAGLYLDPVFGGVWAHGQGGRFSIGEPGVLGFAEVARDATLDGSTGGGGAVGAGALAELVLRPDWSGPLAGDTIRTGQLVAGAGTGAHDGGSLFQHTAGDHLLVRGRWLSLPLVRRALAPIDGVAGLCVAVERGEGTLDKLTFTLAFNRPSLVENPMWAGRAREAIAATTPVDFALETVLADEATPRERVADARGHHLASDRAALAGGTRG